MAETAAVKKSAVAFNFIRVFSLLGKINKFFGLFRTQMSTVNWRCFQICPGLPTICGRMLV